MESDSYVPPSNMVSRAGAGVVGGLAGGIVLGIVLQVLGVIKPIGQLAGRDSYEVSWTVLLTICTVAGCLYGALVGHWVSGQLVPAIGIGVFYGGLVWVLLQLIIIPLRLDGTIFAIKDDSMRTLAAHVAFGVVLGVVYAQAGPRRRYQRRARRQSWGFSYPAMMPRPRRRRRRDDD